MKVVRFTRDMRPYQANHEAALPDGVADTLVTAGDAVLVKLQPGDIELAADAPPPAAVKRGRFPVRKST